VPFRLMLELLQANLASGPYLLPDIGA